MFFNTSNSLRDVTNESFTGRKLYDVPRILGVNFSRHVLAKTATMQRINAPCQAMVRAALSTYFSFWNVSSLAYRHDKAVRCTVRHNSPKSTLDRQVDMQKKYILLRNFINSVWAPCGLSLT